MDLHADQFWNPWRTEEQAAELERAGQIMQEWERAEPNFRRKTKRQLDAEMGRWEREFDRDRVKRELRRQENLSRYDPERETARLALLERQCALAHKTNELAKMRSGEAFPRMDPKRRADQIADLEAAVAQHQAALDQLTPIVSDSEDVPDANGHLPGGRRHSTLFWYQQRRIAEIRDLRERLPEVEAQAKAAEDRSERSKLNAELGVMKRRLENLLAVPRLEAKDMCADCATPAHRHGYVTPPFDGPCAAWPAWGARLKEVRAMLDRMVEANQAHNTAKATPPPKPEPLAIIPSGLPIAQVVQRFQELQQLYPAAEVRRGRANRWELWPADNKA
jgi:hypothetical protein